MDDQLDDPYLPGGTALHVREVSPSVEALDFYPEVEPEPGGRDPADARPQLVGRGLRAHEDGAEDARSPELAPGAEEPEEADNGTRWLRIVDRERLPIWNETKAKEIERYPGRRTAWEAQKAIVAAHKGHESEDVGHVMACLERSCPDEAHVAVRGVLEWKRKTHHDMKHLETCNVIPMGAVPVPVETIEDCPTQDISHLLPPKPLDYLTEYCCESRCYPKGTLDAWSDCIRLPGRARVRRQMERAEHEANLKLSKAMGLGKGNFEATVINTVHQMPWGSKAEDRRVYDPANIPLKDDGWGK